MAFVTGVGVLSSAGYGAEKLWCAALNGQSKLEKVESTWVGRICEEARSQAKNLCRDLGYLKNLCRTYDTDEFCDSTYLALAAIHEAMEQAKWHSLNSDDVILFATTTGQITMWEDPLVAFLEKKIDAPTLAKRFRWQALGLAREQLEVALGVKCQGMVFSSACAASTQALVAAEHFLSSGRAKRVLVVAVELLSTLTLSGFGSFQLLAPNICRPFAANRNGISLSEAAVSLCLEPAAPRATKSLGCILGGATTLDVHHMTAPDPQGVGCERAMRAALKNTDVDPCQVDWVLAHGTGSLHNDLAEGNATKKLFGARQPWISSTKVIHGHPLAASGCLETILALRAMKEDMILGTMVDETHGVDEALGVHVATTHIRGANVQTVVKNTLGFGGVNAALVLQKG